MADKCSVDGCTNLGPYNHCQALGCPRSTCDEHTHWRLVASIATLPDNRDIDAPPREGYCDVHKNMAR